MAHWIIQTNLQNEFEQRSLEKALDVANFSWTGVRYVPFKNTVEGIENVPEEGPFIVMGTTKVVDVLRDSDKFHQAVFYDDADFSPHMWIAKLGRRMLNHDAKLSTVGDVVHRWPVPYEKAFVRPVSGLKSFAGEVVYKEDRREWYHDRSAGGHLFPASTPCVIAAAKPVLEEWRLFMVNGQFISGSMYRKNHRRFCERVVPDVVAEFAERTLELWSPDVIVVMDICRVRKGDLRVVEFNCFNAAGFYEANRDIVLRAVDEHINTAFEVHSYKL